MKPKRLLALLPVLPISLLCACGGTVSTLTFTANWYRNTSLRANLEGTYERLEYAVSFEQNEKDRFSISYTDGVYTTELKNGQVELDDSKTEGYVYSTDLSIKVQFTVNGQASDVFEDSVHTEVQFLSAADGLKPVKSLKTVYCHSPLSDSPSSLAGAYETYSFTYTVDYSDDLSEADTVYTDLLTGSENKTHFSLKGAGSYLDNEQMIFALRGLDLSVGSTFRSLNSVLNRQQQISLTNLNENTAAVDFEADGTQVTSEALAVHTVTLSYSDTAVGQPQSIVYAQTTDPSANTYRNVPLKIDVPLYYTLGTLSYQLVKATFTTK